MKRISLIVVLLLTLQNCSSQTQNEQSKNQTYNMINDKVEYFDRAKIKDSIKKTDFGGYEYASVSTEAANGDIEIFDYSQYYNDLSYRKYPKNGWFDVYKVFHSNGIIAHKEVRSKNFKSWLYGKEYFYDEKGKLIKVINHDEEYKLNFEKVVSIAIDLAHRFHFDDRIGLNDPAQSANLQSSKCIIWRNRKENISLWYILFSEYDTVEAKKSTSAQTPDLRRYHYNRVTRHLYAVLDDSTGNIIFEKEFRESLKEINDDYLQKIIETEEKKATSIYKTHNGKSYTQAEWEAYKEKEYEEYCKRTGKTYIPKDQTTASQNKGRFEADETDFGTPKPKKGFWDNLLG